LRGRRGDPERETSEVPQLEGELESETGRKSKLQGKDIASKPGVEARASSFDPSPLGGSIPLGCAAQEERAARWIGGKQRESSEEGEEGVGGCPIRFGAGGGRKGYREGEGR